MTPTADAMAAAAEAEVQRAQALLGVAPQQAHRHLLEARHLNPGDVRVGELLAGLEIRLGYYREALGHLRDVAVLVAETPGGLALAGLCNLRLGRIEDALDLSCRALALDGANPVALEVRADCRKAGAHWQDAARDYRELLGREGRQPSRARIEFKLAGCLAEMGAHTAAWEIADGLLRRGYDAKAVRELRRRCELGNRRELSAVMGASGWWERVAMRFAARPLARAFSLCRTREVGRKAAASVPDTGFVGEGPRTTTENGT